MQLSDTRIDMKLTGKRLKFLAKLNGYSVKDIQDYLGLANLLRLSELYGVHMEELLVTASVKLINIYELVTVDYNTMEKRILLYASKLCG